MGAAAAPLRTSFVAFTMAKAAAPAARLSVCQLLTPPPLSGGGGGPVAIPRIRTASGCISVQGSTASYTHALHVSARSPQPPRAATSDPASCRWPRRRGGVARAPCRCPSSVGSCATAAAAYPPRALEWSTAAPRRRANVAAIRRPLLTFTASPVTTSCDSRSAYVAELTEHRKAHGLPGFPRLPGVPGDFRGGRPWPQPTGDRNLLWG